MAIDLINEVKARLASIGYTVTEADNSAITYSCNKTRDTIKNDCNVPEIPDGLCYVAIDMSVGDFLMMKKTFSPESLSGLDIGEIVKSIQAGDTTVQFDTSTSSTAALDSIINYFLTSGRRQFACYRTLRW
jgi:hypothetical protein